VLPSFIDLEANEVRSFDTFPNSQNYQKTCPSFNSPGSNIKQGNEKNSEGHKSHEGIHPQLRVYTMNHYHLLQELPSEPEQQP